jgi:hypothetical protein
MSKRSGATSQSTAAMPYDHAGARGTVSSQASGTVSGGDASRIQGDVPAVAGGVGVNARAMLSNEARPDHNVKMVFSLETGNYLADVDVKVTNSGGKTVIDDVSDGPWLYAKLPAGSYTAKASYGGKMVTRQFSVGRSGQRVAYFRWPASVEQQVSASVDVNQILGTGPQEPQR